MKTRSTRGHRWRQLFPLASSCTLDSSWNTSWLCSDIMSGSRGDAFGIGTCTSATGRQLGSGLGECTVNACYTTTMHFELLVMSVSLLHPNAAERTYRCQCRRCLSLYDAQIQQTERMVSMLEVSVSLWHTKTAERTYGVNAGSVCPYDIKTQQKERMMSMLEVSVSLWHPNTAERTCKCQRWRCLSLTPKIQPEEHTVSVLEVSVPMTSKHSRKKATLMLGVWHWHPNTQYVSAGDVTQYQQRSWRQC